MTEGKVLSIVPGRSDAELAATHRSAVVEALKPVMEAIDRAKADGFVINFALGVDFLGQASISTLTIAKLF